MGLADGTLVGFVYGVTGTGTERTYHHSQTAVVDPDMRGRAGHPFE